MGDLPFTASQIALQIIVFGLLYAPAGAALIIGLKSLFRLINNRPSDTHQSKQAIAVRVFVVIVAMTLVYAAIHATIAASTAPIRASDGGDTWVAGLAVLLLFFNTIGSGLLAAASLALKSLEKPAQAATDVAPSDTTPAPLS